jgi:pimeloyl-ACP methyl ester carboxylesterase
MKTMIKASLARNLPELRLPKLDPILALQVLGLIAPSLCARVIANRFVTPSRMPIPRSARATLEKAHRFPFESRGSTYQALSWGEGPSILLAHGWSGQSGQFHAWIPALLAQGFSVIALDAPAHGSSPGKQTNADEYAAAIQSLALRVGGVRAVVAHSFGAMASLLAVRRGLKPEKIILIAPSMKPEYFFDQLCESLRLAPAVKIFARNEIPKRVGLRWEDLTTETLAAAVKQPVLILHDPADREVSWSHASELVSELARGTLEALPGTGHRRILESQEAIVRATQFLNKSWSAD